MTGHLTLIFGAAAAALLDDGYTETELRDMLDFAFRARAASIRGEPRLTAASDQFTATLRDVVGGYGP